MSRWLLVALFVAAFMVGVSGFGGQSADVSLGLQHSQHAEGK